MSRPGRRLWSMALLALLLAPAGCGLRQPQPLRHAYLLEAARTAPSPLAGRRLVLLVRQASVADAYEGREFVYRLADGSLISDFYHLFFSPPAELVSEQVRLWLNADDMDPQVVGSYRMSEVTHILETRVRALYRDERFEPPRAVMELAFHLVVPEGAGSAGLYSKVYRREPGLPDREPASLVAAWNRALTEILTEMEADLAGLPLAPAAGARP